MSHTTYSTSYRSIPFVNLTFVGAALAAPALLPCGPNAMRLLLLAIASVVLIVFGERGPRETRWERRGLPGREAYVPVFALALAMTTGLVPTSLALQTCGEKSELVALILSFAMVSYGIGQSGFFEFAAYHFVAWSRGQTRILIVYFYLLSSLLTYVTSNDIVVLILTPIIISVCFQGQIDNPKLLLLGQFIAANTVSMGMLIGSPTNIIVAQASRISFVDYFLLMLPPSLAAFLGSYMVVECTAQFAASRGTRSKMALAYTVTFDVGQVPSGPRFDAHMRNWLLLFSSVVVVVAVATEYQLSLFWVAVPAFAAAAVYIVLDPHRIAVDTAASQRLLQALARLPYGIIFFGLSFFVLAAAIVRSDIAVLYAIPALQSLLERSPYLVGAVGVGVSGMVVNILNDLPAAALLTELLEQLRPGTDVLLAQVLTQAILIGVNIGCYLTPVGALAGLIWFSVMRTEVQRQERQQRTIGFKMRLPTRLELVAFGLLNFVVVVPLASAAGTCGLLAYAGVAGSPAVGAWEARTGILGLAILCGCSTVFIRRLRQLRRQVLTAHDP